MYFQKIRRALLYNVLRYIPPCVVSVPLISRKTKLIGLCVSILHIYFSFPFFISRIFLPNFFLPIFQHPLFPINTFIEASQYMENYIRECIQTCAYINGGEKKTEKLRRLYGNKTQISFQHNSICSAKTK